MKNLITLLCLALGVSLSAQTTGQWLFQKKAAGVGFTPFGVTPTNNYVFGLNGSGVPTMLNPATFGSVDMGNILWVSDEGNDGTAERGNPGKPYATIQAAHDDASDGDEIYCIGNGTQGDLESTKGVVIMAQYTVFDEIEVTDGTLIIYGWDVSSLAVSSGASVISRNTSFGSISGNGLLDIHGGTHGSVTGNGSRTFDGAQIGSLQVSSSGSPVVTLRNTTLGADMTIYNTSAQLYFDRLTIKGGITNAAFTTLSVEAFNTVSEEDTAGQDLDISGYGNCFGCTEGGGGAVAWEDITGSPLANDSFAYWVDTLAIDAVTLGGGDVMIVSGAGESIANGTYTRNDAASDGSLTVVGGSARYEKGDLRILLADGSPDNWFIYDVDLEVGYYVGSDDPEFPNEVASWTSLDGGFDPPPTVTGGGTPISIQAAFDSLSAQIAEIEGGGGGTPDLETVLGEGNTTGAFNIVVSSGRRVEFHSGSNNGRLQPAALSDDVEWTLPAESGTLQLVDGPIASTQISDATTVGINILQLPDPSAIRFIKINADNSVTAESAATFRTSIGAPSGTGSANGTNTGDQSSIVGITGTLSEFNAALTGADFATGGGTATGTNTGDQTSIVGFSSTLSAFNTAINDADVPPTTRTIATTSPLSGGGDLSANRTLTIADGAADGSTKGAASFTAADFNATSGNVSLDYANGQAASASNKGFLSSTDWTTFNAKPSVLAKPSNEGRTSTSRTADTDLKVALAANEKATLTFTVFTNSSSTGGMKWRISGPASPTQVKTRWQNIVFAGTNSVSSIDGYNGSDVTMTATAGQEASLVIMVTVVNGSNAGDVAFEWACNSAAGTTTVFSGSTVQVTKY